MRGSEKIKNDRSGQKLRWFEIVIPLFLVVLYTLLLIENVALITNIEFFRPENTLVFMVISLAISVIFFTFWIMQISRKKLKSTKKKSVFAKNLEISSKERGIIPTQTVYSSDVAHSGNINTMPPDIDENNPYVVEFNFSYEPKLNI
jgi:predicted membrane protein